jgi:hypothetical protein
VSWNQLTWNKKVIEEDTFLPLGDMLFRRAYQKDKETFYYLHDLLQNDLEKHLFPKEGGTRGMRRNPYLINTKIRLSIAICFFSGASPYDLMVSHGVSYMSNFYSICGVVDVVNNSQTLKIQFHNHQEQKKIARVFEKMLGAGFDNITGAIDGILI